MGSSDFDAGKSAQSIAVNYLGIANPLETLIPLMIGRGRGHLALTASVAGYRGLPQAAAYAPSKAAVIALAETLAPDLARKGVSVSVINPGFVETPMTAVNTFPMPFLISPEDAATAIIRGLERKRFEIAFPWQMVVLLKFARVLPYPMFFWFARNFLMPRDPR
jgi:short-subunit dehydrogenase